ncbi:MAG: YfbU family protein [Janthinobacterium lividum]
MKLSVVERQILWNQYEILKHLGVGGVKSSYEEMQKIIEHGYTAFYEDNIIHMDKEEVSDEDFDLVTGTLRMFDQISQYETGNGKIDDHRAHFIGFDGNEEHTLQGIASFLIDVQKKWSFLNIESCNSHSPTAPMYRRMVEKWKTVGGANTRAQINEILAAGTYPSD